MTEQVRGMGLFLVWRHKLLCMHIYKEIIWCKSVCDIKSGIDPCPLLARSWNRWWPDFVTFTASKKSRVELKSDKKAQHVSNRCKDLFKRKKYFGVRCSQWWQFAFFFINRLLPVEENFLSKFQVKLSAPFISFDSSSTDYPILPLKHSYTLYKQIRQNLTRQEFEKIWYHYDQVREFVTLN